MQSEQVAQIFHREIPPNISFFDLIKLCQTSKSWQDICNDRRTWIYLIKRDLVNWDEAGGDEGYLDFLNDDVFPADGSTDPREHYEYEYIVNSGEHYSLDKEPPEYEELRKRYILNKLKAYSENQPREPQTWLCESYKGKAIIDGFNKYDIARKYLLNVVFPYDANIENDPIPGGMKFFHELEISLNIGTDHPDIHTFDKLFDYFVDLFVSTRLDGIPHYY